MNNKFNPNFISYKDTINSCILNFFTTGKMLSDGKRNKIKIFEFDTVTLNIKSFKKPNLLNQIVYRYLRKSKAQRSFEYATLLEKYHIGTPTPIAFYENTSFFGLKDSYYVCKHLNNVVEFREIVENENFENRDEIIRQFTRFTCNMHEQGVEFLDHSPGNTLIKKNDDKTYSFFLVDLNRMKFHKSLDFTTRMKNLSKITHKKDMIVTMSNEYALITGEDEKVIYETMWKFTADFQSYFHRKKRIKKKLKFWKK